MDPHAAPADDAPAASCKARPTRTPLRRALRWLIETVIVIAGVLGILAVPLACTTVVVPPAGVAEPVPVFLLDHGRTPSLVLPGESAGMVRYAYGDWDYYALGNTGWWSGAKALFWPTQGALGRRELAAAPHADNVRRHVRVGIENLYTLQIERRDVARLRERLDAVYRAHLNTRLDNPSADLAFVHHPRSYTYFRNSNHVLAEWLEALGCQTRGPAYYSRWRIEPPPPQQQAAAQGTSGRRPARPRFRSRSADTPGDADPRNAHSGQSRRIPLWLKVLYTLLVAVIIPVYWVHYGPSNYLWFSDIALLMTVPALWLEHRLIASTMLVAVLLPELAWNLDFFTRLLTGWNPVGLADYMFERERPLYLRGLSLFHVVLPPLLVWMVWRLGYDRRAWAIATALALIVFPLSRLVSTPEDNVNWTYGWGDRPQHLLPPWAYVGLLMIAFPLLVYGPTHLLLVYGLTRWGRAV